jgi:hypothetical protein
MSRWLSQNHEQVWWHRLPAYARHRQDAGATKYFVEQLETQEVLADSIRYRKIMGIGEIG